MLLGVGLFCASTFLLVMHVNTYIILVFFASAIFCTANSYLSNQRSILDGRICFELGNLSYSVYMIHAFFLTASVDYIWPRLASGRPPIWYGAIVGPILLAASLVTFHLFESPTKALISGWRRIKNKPTPHYG